MTDYTVEKLSIDKIEDFAAKFLRQCPLLPNGAIDILATLRLPTIETHHGKKTLRLNLVADDLLPDKLAQVWASGGRVTVTARASLWNRAEEGGPEALKELRHEFGHVLLHSSAHTSSRVTLDRQLGGNAVHKYIDDDRSSEKQADAIAACLAMPPGKIKPHADIRDIIADWNVTLAEAKWRLEGVRLRAPKRLSEKLKRDIAAICLGNEVPAKAQELWDQLPSAPGWPRETARLMNGFLVEYREYNRYSQTGWALEGARIVPLMSKMQG